jgi:hypothetical protein
MSQVFDRTGHGFLNGVFPGNAFTPRAVRVTEGDLTQMEWSEP